MGEAIDKKDINAQVPILNETTLNVFQNYVSCTYIIIGDKDHVWMNENMKTKTKTKKILYKQYIQNGRFETDFAFLKTFITEFNKLISSPKPLYYENLEKKLNNPLLQTKT